MIKLGFAIFMGRSLFTIGFQTKITQFVKKAFFAYFGVKIGDQLRHLLLTLWDSRADNRHYIETDWSSRTSFKSGFKNVIFTHLKLIHKIFFFHIKLCLMKNYTKVVTLRWAKDT